MMLTPQPMAGRASQQNYMRQAGSGLYPLQPAGLSSDSAVTQVLRCWRGAKTGSGAWQRADRQQPAAG